MKKCIKCKTEKPKDNFHKDKARKDGLFPYCRECRGAKKRSGYRKPRRLHSKGYILLNIPDHPLAQRTGYIYEHRFVFYKKYKGQPLECEFCGETWLWRIYIDHIDHIDENKQNNDIGNLRPLCNSCNCGRTKKIHSDAKRNMAVTYRGVTDTPEAWSRNKLVHVTAACIRYRKSKGMSDYDALFMPKKTHNANQKNGS